MDEYWLITLSFAQTKEQNTYVEFALNFNNAYTETSNARNNFIGLYTRFQINPRN